MNILARRIIGILLIIAAAGGLIFSLFGVFWIWSSKPQVTRDVTDAVKLYRDTLATTEAGLVVAGESLTTTIDSVVALQATISATANTVDATIPMVNSLTSLTKIDLPQTLTATQTSLAAAQESAKIIDSVLTAITSIPFVSKDIYNPPVPLHIALQQVSESLMTLPGTLKTLDKSMEATSGNLTLIQTDIDLMASNLQGIHDSLVDAQAVIGDYQLLVSDLSGRADRIQARLVSWINLSAIVLTFVLVWSVILQLGLFVLGFDLLNRPATVPA